VNASFRPVLCLQKLGQNFALGASRKHIFEEHCISNFFLQICVLIENLAACERKMAIFNFMMNKRVQNF